MAECELTSRAWALIRDGGVTWQDSKTDPRFTVEWVEENTSDVEMGEWFEVACTVGWEQVEELALEIFGRYGVRRRDVRQDGRSGGWCVVEGLSDVESWDAVMLGTGAVSRSGVGPLRTTCPGQCWT